MSTAASKGKRVIAVVCEKGGVGKTSTTASLAAITALNGRPVIAIDTDRQNNLATLLLPGGYTIGLDEVYAGSHSLAEAVAPTEIENLSMVAAGLRLNQAELGLAGLLKREEILMKHIAALDTDATILIDCPPNLGLLTVNAMMAADEVLIPVGATDTSSVLGLASVHQVLGDLYAPNERPPVHIVLNRFDKRSKMSEQTLALIESAGIELTGPIIMERTIVQRAPDRRAPVVISEPKSETTQQYRELAEALDLIGEQK